MRETSVLITSGTSSSSSSSSTNVPLSSTYLFCPFLIPTLSLLPILSLWRFSLPYNDKLLFCLYPSVPFFPFLLPLFLCSLLLSSLLLHVFFFISVPSSTFLFAQPSNCSIPFSFHSSPALASLTPPLPSNSLTVPFLPLSIPSLRLLFIFLSAPSLRRLFLPSINSTCFSNLS